MNQFEGYIWMAVLIALGVVAAGAWVYTWLARRALRSRQSTPENWPLFARLLVNTEESQVLQWLCKTFPQHQVSIKIPVIRFTRPLELDQGQNLYRLLNGVYCTFTVCASDGHVVGCADVMGRNGLASSNRQFKQALLTQCHIPYCILKPGSLPATAAIRSEFLGETAPTEPVFAPTGPALEHEPRAKRERELEEALLAEARLNLSTTLDRQRRHRDSGFLPLTPDSDSHAPAHAFKNNFEGSDFNNNYSLLTRAGKKILS
ncbi:MAG: hypothetical protein ABJA84_11345 [Polaromonas sp.]